MIQSDTATKSMIQSDTAMLFYFIPAENNLPVQEATETSDMERGSRATALYDFTGEADNELTFCEGDIILVQGPVEGAEDWCWGVRKGNRGIFPAAFVEIVS